MAASSEATNTTEDNPSSQESKESRKNSVSKKVEPKQKVGDHDSSGFWTCKLCPAKSIDANSMFLEVEICLEHYCHRCSKLNAKQHEVMGRANVLWVCGTQCKRVITEAVGMRGLLEKLGMLMFLNRMDAFDKRLEKIERSTNEIEKETHQATLSHNPTEILSTIEQRLGTVESLCQDVQSKTVERQDRLETLKNEMNSKMSMVTLDDLSQSDGEQEASADDGVGENRSNPWSTAAKWKKGPDLTAILRDVLAEQKREEEALDGRDHNIIIHHVAESTATEASEKKDHDLAFVNSLFKDHLGVPVSVKVVHRIGKEKSDETSKKRPMKVVLERKEDRLVIFSRLNRLKNAEDSYRRISVTADLTSDEREKVKKLVQEAKNRTGKETGEWIHVVRGTYPKMEIVRIRPRSKTD